MAFLPTENLKYPQSHFLESLQGLNKNFLESSEMAQLLTVHAPKPKDLSSIHRTHIVKGSN